MKQTRIYLEHIYMISYNHAIWYHMFKFILLSLLLSNFFRKLRLTNKRSATLID